MQLKIGEIIAKIQILLESVRTELFEHRFRLIIHHVLTVGDVEEVKF